MHESLDEFKFRPATTTDSRVICPCASEKLTYNVVKTLAPLFLIRSSPDRIGTLVSMATDSFHRVIMGISL